MICWPVTPSEAIHGYRFFPDSHCARTQERNRNVSPLGDGTPYGWTGGTIAECAAKCTADPKCTAFVRYRFDGGCFWKFDVTLETIHESTGHDCYLATRRRATRTLGTDKGAVRERRFHQGHGCTACSLANANCTRGEFYRASCCTDSLTCSVHPFQLTCSVAWILIYSVPSFQPTCSVAWVLISSVPPFQPTCSVAWMLIYSVPPFQPTCFVAWMLIYSVPPFQPTCFVAWMLIYSVPPFQPTCSVAWMLICSVPPFQPTCAAVWMLIYSVPPFQPTCSAVWSSFTSQVYYFVHRS